MKLLNYKSFASAFVLVLLLSLAGCGGSKNKNKQENLQELTALLINQDQMLKAMEMMVDQLAQMGKIDKAKTKEIIGEMAQKFNSDETRKEFMDIYDRHFNDKEIEELLAFYKSSVGKKTMEKMPEIMAEASHIGMKVAQDVMMKYMPKEEEVKKAQNRPAKK